MLLSWRQLIHAGIAHMAVTQILNRKRVLEMSIDARRTFVLGASPIVGILFMTDASVAGMNLLSTNRIVNGC